MRLRMLLTKASTTSSSILSSTTSSSSSAHPSASLLRRLHCAAFSPPPHGGGGSARRGLVTAATAAASNTDAAMPCGAAAAAPSPPAPAPAHAAAGGGDDLAALAAAAAAAVPGRPPKVVIVTGPTAVGKTALSLDLAQALGGEIISADSVQVFEGLDVGADKLPAAQRRGVPHHLLDVLRPGEDFSAGDFALRAREAAADIIRRGKVPIVVGGTGFYLRWFIYGKASTPPSTPETAARARELIAEAWRRRAEAEGLAAGAPLAPPSPLQDLTPAAAAAAAAAVAFNDQEGTQQQQQQQQQQHPPMLPPAPPGLGADARWDAAVNALAALGDAGAAARVRPERNNWYRLTRALQIAFATGGTPRAMLDVDESAPLAYDFRCFYLHRPRVELYDRIALRVEEMLLGGLLDEALLLLDAGLAPNASMATRAIGYRQATQLLQAAIEAGDGDGDADGDGDGAVTLAQLRQLALDVATASRNLVKHQTTWFRDDALFRWVDASSSSPSASSSSPAAAAASAASPSSPPSSSSAGVAGAGRWQGGGGGGDAPAAGGDAPPLLRELLAELAKPRHEGGCLHDSGRLDAAARRELKRYAPTLRLLVAEDEEGRGGGGAVAALLRRVNDAVAERRRARRLQQQQPRQQSDGGT